MDDHKSFTRYFVNKVDYTAQNWQLFFRDQYLPLMNPCIIYTEIHFLKIAEVHCYKGSYVLFRCFDFEITA